jgi:hypothetical protein
MGFRSKKGKCTNKESQGKMCANACLGDDGPIAMRRNSSSEPRQGEPLRGRREVRATEVEAKASNELMQGVARQGKPRRGSRQSEAWQVMIREEASRVSKQVKASEVEPM